MNGEEHTLDSAARALARRMCAAGGVHADEVARAARRAAEERAPELFFDAALDRGSAELLRACGFEQDDLVGAWTLRGGDAVQAFARTFAREHAAARTTTRTTTIDPQPRRDERETLHLRPEPRTESEIRAEQVRLVEQAVRASEDKVDARVERARLLHLRAQALMRQALDEKVGRRKAALFEARTQQVLPLHADVIRRAVFGNADTDTSTGADTLEATAVRGAHMLNELERDIRSAVDPAFDSAKHEKRALRREMERLADIFVENVLDSRRKAREAGEPLFDFDNAPTTDAEVDDMLRGTVFERPKDATPRFGNDDDYDDEDAVFAGSFYVPIGTGRGTGANKHSGARPTDEQRQAEIDANEALAKDLSRDDKPLRWFSLRVLLLARDFDIDTFGDVLRVLVGVLLLCVYFPYIVDKFDYVGPLRVLHAYQTMQNLTRLLVMRRIGASVTQMTHKVLNRMEDVGEYGKDGQVVQSLPDGEAESEGAEPDGATPQSAVVSADIGPDASGASSDEQGAALQHVANDESDPQRGVLASAMSAIVQWTGSGSRSGPGREQLAALVLRSFTEPGEVTTETVTSALDNMKTTVPPESVSSWSAAQFIAYVLTLKARREARVNIFDLPSESRQAYVETAVSSLHDHSFWQNAFVAASRRGYDMSEAIANIAGLTDERGEPLEAEELDEAIIKSRNDPRETFYRIGAFQGISKTASNLYWYILGGDRIDASRREVSAFTVATAQTVTEAMGDGPEQKEAASAFSNYWSSSGGVWGRVALGTSFYAMTVFRCRVVRSIVGGSGRLAERAGQLIEEAGRDMLTIEKSAESKRTQSSGAKYGFLWRKPLGALLSAGGLLVQSAGQGTAFVTDLFDWPLFRVAPYMFVAYEAAMHASTFIDDNILHYGRYALVVGVSLFMVPESYSSTAMTLARTTVSALLWAAFYGTVSFARKLLKGRAIQVFRGAKYIEHYAATTVSLGYLAWSATTSRSSELSMIAAGGIGTGMALLLIATDGTTPQVADWLLSRAPANIRPLLINLRRARYYTVSRRRRREMDAAQKRA